MEEKRPLIDGPEETMLDMDSITLNSTKSFDGYSPEKIRVRKDFLDGGLIKSPTQNVFRLFAWRLISESKGF
jgi:hypothetical protein